MLVRVRTNVGIWRVDGLDPSTATTKSILNGIRIERPGVEYNAPLSFDPACQIKIDPNATLSSQAVAHGSMIHCRVVPESCAGSGAGGTRIVSSDGSILVSESSASSGGGGFRKGTLPLRDMKMAWTLQEFTALDERFIFRVKRQEERWVGSGGVSMDMESANVFQSYLRNFQFKRQRFAFLYGRFVDEDVKGDEDAGNAVAWVKESSSSSSLPAKNEKVVVEAIYEPPQEADPSPEGYRILDDCKEETVETLASMVGLKRVGWIFGHPPREDGFQLSSAEVITAAEFQLEAAGGVEPTPFVTVKVTVGEDGTSVSFEAFQVSLQCMEMVAEGALEVLPGEKGEGCDAGGDNPGYCKVNETFTAIMEGKETPKVENNFFLTTIPIVQHNSERFVSMFPPSNRDSLGDGGRIQSREEMKRQLQKSGKNGWTFADLLSDFHLLLYLCNDLDVETDIKRISQSVVDRDIPLDEGHKLLIASMAGMDGSY